MVKLKLALAACALVLVAGQAEAGNRYRHQSGCEAKRTEIQRQLDYAVRHENAYRVAGLRRALAGVEANCTPAGLSAAQQEKIADKEEKVREREEDLAEAIRDGRTDKIVKQQRKLEEAKAELAAARAELAR